MESWRIYHRRLAQTISHPNGRDSGATDGSFRATRGGGHIDSLTSGPLRFWFLQGNL